MCYGQLIIEALEQHIKSSGILTLYLRSASDTANRFWKSAGFKKLPDLSCYTDSFYYKIIADHQAVSRTGLDCIEVHAWESKQVSRWPLHFKAGSSELLQPIITPAEGDWSISRVTAGIPGAIDKVKYFRSNSCFEDPFLIITSL